MSDAKKQSPLSSLMPQQWIAILLFVAGLAAVKLSSLDSTRPPVETSAVGSQQGRFTLSNLEDPFAIIQQQNEVNKGTRTFSFPSPRPWPKYKTFRIFAVFTNSPSDASKAEIRQTDRQAIASALTSRNYIPSENRSLRLYDHEIRRGKTHDAVEVKIPYEWWHQSNGDTQIEVGENAPPVLLLWLNSEEFGPDLSGDIEKDARSCLDELRQIVKLAELDLKQCPSRVSFFGPNDTDSLIRLVVGEELAHDIHGITGISKPIFPESQNVEFFSAMSTAEDTVIIEGLNRKLEEVFNRKAKAQSNLADVMNQYLGLTKNFQGTQQRFRRTIATDDRVSRRLVDELISRGIGDRIKGKKGSLLLISELDTLYGRKLPEAFRNAWIERTGSIDSENIKVLTYFKGLDGRNFQTSPAATNDKAGGDTGKKGTGGEAVKHGGGNGTAGSNQPRGIAQSDALRRMGFEMLYTDDELDDVVAVGVLGSDVFDKLLVIRALRPVMKDAFFFTNNLDAWMWDEKEIETTRGVIAAAPAGVEMGDILEDTTTIRDDRLHILPFRNSYQSALFRTAYLALDSDASWPTDAREPLLFEIDSSGPVRIDGKDWKWPGTFLLVPPFIALVFGPIPLIVIFRRMAFSDRLKAIRSSDSKQLLTVFRMASQVSKIEMVDKIALLAVLLCAALSTSLPVLMLTWCWMAIAMIISERWCRTVGSISYRGWIVPGIILPTLMSVIVILEISLFFANRREIIFGNRIGAWFYLGMISVGVLLSSLGLWWLHEIWMRWQDNPAGLNSGSRKYQTDEMETWGRHMHLARFERFLSLKDCSNTRRAFAILAVSAATLALCHVAFEYQPHFFALRTGKMVLPIVPHIESMVTGASITLHSVLWLSSFGMLAKFYSLLNEINRAETPWSANIVDAVLPVVSFMDFAHTRHARDCTDMHYLADRTRGWSSILVAPFLSLLPMSAGGLLMDMAPRWSWLVCSVMVLGAAAVVAMGYACHYKLLKMREDVVREVQTMPSMKSEDVKSLADSLLGLEHGLFRPFSQQPVVRLFVIALALMGTNEVVKEVVRRL